MGEYKIRLMVPSYDLILENGFGECIKGFAIPPEVGDTVDIIEFDTHYYKHEIWARKTFRHAKGRLTTVSCIDGKRLRLKFTIINSGKGKNIQ